jgi:hypothetical protein
MIITLNSLILAATHFIVLHNPQGQEIDINTREISSIREVRRDAKEHFAKGTSCLVVMTNGHINTVVEDCAAVRTMIEAIERGD